MIRASAFAAGFALLLVAASVGGLIALRSASTSVDPGSPAFAWIDIAMGVVLLITCVVSLTRQGDIAEQRERLRAAPIALYFGLGMVMMLSNLNTLAVAVSILHEIAIADVSSFERGLALAVTDLVILLPVLAPIGLCIAAPGTADRVLPKIRAAVDRYGVRVGIVVFAAIGVYLLIEGISHL